MTGAPAEPAPVGLGLVGCGAFGRYVLDAIRDLPDVRVVAVADPDPERREALAAAHGAVACETFEALLARPDVDAVAVTTPPATHAAMAGAALRAGKHVFCEKPLATTAAEAAQVRDAADASAGVLVVDHVLRYNPVLRMLERLRDEGLLDAPRRFAFENDASDEDLGPDHWFWNASHSGGIFVEHGVHFFDAARSLLGTEPLSVQATGVPRDPTGLVDIVVATALHPGGAVATHTHSFTHAHRCERQLMRLDYGFAEARVTGWIPTYATVTAWTDDAGADRWQLLPSRTDELLHVPGVIPHGEDRVHVTVHRDAGTPHPCRGRGEQRVAPHRVEVVVDLGGEDRKQHVYTGCVRAAFVDLLRCARDGGVPVAGAYAGLTAVAVAEAATLALQSGATLPVSVPVAAASTRIGAQTASRGDG